MLNGHDSRRAFEDQLEWKSTAELIAITLTENDDDPDDPGWIAASILRARPTREVFEAAKQLCESDDPNKRTVGVFILVDLGSPIRPFLDEVLAILFNLIDTEQDTAVLADVALVLGFLSPEPRKVKPLLKLKSHPNPDVRYGVTYGLLGEDDPLAIEALTALSSDEDDNVRDWATFGIGAQIDTDTTEIREALFKRAIDSDDKSNAPGEGLFGLAKRHDVRAFDLILKRLQSGNVGNLIFEAAEELADPRLLPLLITLQNNPKYFNYHLDDVINACKNGA